MLEKKTNEKGSISVLFAFLFVALMLFTSFATDAGMLYYQQLRLKEVGNVIREARLNNETVLQNSTHPAETLERLAKDYAVKNGLRADQVTVDFADLENESTYTHRYYEMNIYLTDTYQYKALSILGFREQKIRVTIHGYGDVENSAGVWKP
ncbi:hypothetical protein FL966_11745 [Caproiciproducens galactitolivorans]|uniref:Putative Flp pilus-assembly TadG-like N-terminal domain-containing protein n=1 Tax=Caproiciproducens galactitolivorans TaxID=642589 RepID=A0A4Z0Y3I0_9FIRM|nr:Tad domain-containing protein [Caproiciproducens galactitolivorans]QEY35676.1 hypothetical protein FL966_11745 [Caproiciproducens galactitolivorans]TGJ77407.1 hypothetical protein CAGA_07770 [Caproiciproducens galactitolivorans]